MKKNQIDISQSSTEEKKSVNKAGTKKSAKSDKPKKPNKIKKFFKDLKSEVKKVVWPTKKQVINNTGVVLIAVVISALFIWGIDSAFYYLFKLILKA